MFNKNSRINSPVKVHNYTSDRIRKIRDLVGKAMGQIKKQSRRSPSRSPTTRIKSDESSQSETIQEVLANLKKGYLMIKHSQKINEPHDKFIYLSTDNRYLCWKSLTKQDQKRIEITAINKVIKQGSQFYIKSTQIKHISRCLVIVSRERNLQLEATSEMEAQYFKYELYRVMKYWKAMRLNYKYSKQ